ncbi:hypothetical protein [Candidatus Nitrosocosmicus hydrocola]|uniref:hypothetical protein n=1 Tax=Candidatus Nitrosocosmicus hydrocola TaxID=1826872 RepID=UPI0013723C37|nr:hypothetical protein [Candidatus Nitrosocosmicus hydrocola]
MQYILPIILLAISLCVILAPSLIYSVLATSDPDAGPVREKVPVVVSGDNV